MNDGYPKDFFALNEFIYHVAGGWLFKNNKRMSVLKCLAFLLTIVVHLCGGVFTLLQIMFLGEVYKDINKLVRLLGMLLSNLITLFKLGTLMSNRNGLVRIMGILQDKEYRYEGVGDFNPGQMLQKAMSTSQVFAIMLPVIYGSVGILGHITAELIINRQVKGKYLEGNTTCYNYMPYLCYVPISTIVKRNCELVFAFIDFSLIAMTLSSSSFDGYYVALLNCLSTQLIIVGFGIRTIRQRVLLRLNLPVDFEVFCDDQHPELEEELYREFTRLTKHICILLKIATDLENFFHLVTLAQALECVIVFASCLYVATMVSVSAPEFSTVVQYFLCIFVELTLFCWNASRVTYACEKMMFAVYDSDWLSGSKRFKSSLLLTMVRLQKPVYLTFGKFYPLTLPSLVSVCKGSFSYYTVFKSV